MKIAIGSTPIKLSTGLVSLSVSASAFAQRATAAASAASDAIVIREPPGYPDALYALYGLLALFALLGLIAAIFVFANARRDKKTEAQIAEVVRAELRRIDQSR